MKKFFTMLISCAITLCCLGSSLVFAATPAGSYTTITFKIEADYTITIPPTLEVKEENNEMSFTVAKNSLIEANKKLTFTITDTENYDEVNNRFRLVNGNDASVYLDYEIVTKENKAAVVKGEAFLEATCVDVNSGKSAALCCNIIGTPEAAGTYTDVITVTVAKEDIN